MSQSSTRVSRLAMQESIRASKSVSADVAVMSSPDISQTRLVAERDVALEAAITRIVNLVAAPLIAKAGQARTRMHALTNKHSPGSRGPRCGVTASATATILVFRTL